MAPLVTIVTLFLVIKALSLIGIQQLDGWYVPLRYALAGMFLLTASAHWGKRRGDLVRMVPPTFPCPELLVTLTGILEVLGAAGLILPRMAPYAALGLALLLLALFPANVYAAREHLTIGGRPVTALLPRTLLQVLFLAATIAVFITGI